MQSGIEKTVLITGGCGFVGSSLAILLKRSNPNYAVIAYDNLMRLGSELNVPRIEKEGIVFIKGDVRNREEINAIGKVDLIIDCAAEPSVMAGKDGSPLYLIDTNLGGTINCLELARTYKSDFIFLSTSRVYPVSALNSLHYAEAETRFVLSKDQSIEGASADGIREQFPLKGVRTMYGATKLSSELLIQEYANNYGIRVVINRCGVITGPWQFGKVDQGVVVLWIARHVFTNNKLSYIGYGGQGKQVRDFLHVDDLFDALMMQMGDMDTYKGEIFNIGGGIENSLSLLEMTALCQEITGNSIPISSVKEDRQGDVRIYITDSSKFKNISGWAPRKNGKQTFTEIAQWIENNKTDLEKILN